MKRHNLRELCITLIKGNLKHREFVITSWDEFAQSREWGLIGYDEPSQWTLLRAMAYGKKQGWLRACWGGVGMTPYAGSAHRERMYEITTKAIEDLKLEVDLRILGYIKELEQKEH